MGDAGFTYVPVRSARRKKRPGAAAAAVPADPAAAAAATAAAEAAQLARRREIVQGKRRMLEETPHGEQLLGCLRTELGLASSSAQERQEQGDEVEALAARLDALGTAAVAQPAVSVASGALVPSAVMPRRILHLGLGSVKDARVPQIQLALLLVIRDLLGGDACPVEGYDPVWNEEDAAVLRSYDTQLLAQNKRASHTLEEATLVYMPHCGRALYEHLLRANWSAEGLSRLVLICNGFARYADLAHKLEVESPCLSRILPHLHAVPLPLLPAPNHDALNDVCIQRFVPRAADGTPIDAAALPKSFWDLPPPVDEAPQGDEVQ